MRCGFAKWVGAHPTNYSTDRITHEFAVIHIAQGTSQSGIDAWFNEVHPPPGGPTSAHFSISKLGVLHQHVDTAETAYHCGGWNDRAIGIEHLGYSGQWLTLLQRRKLKRLLTWIHAEHGTRLAYVVNPYQAKGGVIGHGKIPEGALSHPNCPGQPVLAQVENMLRATRPVLALGYVRPGTVL